MDFCDTAKLNILRNISTLILQSENLREEELGMPIEKYVDVMMECFRHMYQVRIFDTTYHMLESHEILFPGHAKSGKFSSNLKVALTSSAESFRSLTFYPVYRDTDLIYESFLFLQDQFNARYLSMLRFYQIILILHPFHNGNGRIAKMLYVWHFHNPTVTSVLNEITNTFTAKNFISNLERINKEICTTGQMLVSRNDVINIIRQICKMLG